MPGEDRGPVAEVRPREGNEALRCRTLPGQTGSNCWKALGPWWANLATRKSLTRQAGQTHDGLSDEFGRWTNSDGSVRAIGLWRPVPVPGQTPQSDGDGLRPAFWSRWGSWESHATDKPVKASGRTDWAGQARSRWVPASRRACRTRCRSKSHCTPFAGSASRPS